LNVEFNVSSLPDDRGSALRKNIDSIGLQRRELIVEVLDKVEARM